MFKKGDRIKYLQDNTILRLSRGKIYVVLGNDDGTLTVVNDVNLEITLQGNNFELEKANPGADNADSLPYVARSLSFIGALPEIDLDSPEKACTCLTHGPNGLFAVGCICGAIKPYKVNYA